MRRGSRQALGDYFAKAGVKAYWLAAFILNLLLWAFAWLIVSRLHSDLVILHYNVILGVDNLGPPSHVFILPAIALGLFLLNNLLAIHNRHDKVLLNLFLVSSIFMQLVFALGLYSVYLVNYVKIF
jgi:hypothetical protein